jgi:hypothetical protein
LGGFAALSRTPNPKQSIVIALAGPAVNLLIAAAIYGYVRFVGQPLPTGFMYEIWSANLALALFNLLPAYPLDGGHVLRALLTQKYGPVFATSVSTGFGQIFGWGLIVFGLFYNQMLLLAVGVTVLVAAVQEGGWLRLPQRRSRPAKRKSRKEDDYRGFDEDRRMQTELERRRLKELFERSFKDDGPEDKPGPS